jgi:hypothetical protein
MAPPKTKQTEVQAKLLPWQANAVRWTPNESTFPLTCVHQARRAQAFLFTILGALAAALPVYQGVVEYKSIGFHWLTLALHFPFLYAGSLLLLFGLSRFYARRLYTIRKEEVECDQVRFLNRTHWKEPIRKYEGTLKQIKFYGGGRAGRSRVYYEVILRHKDPKKSVVLFRSYSWRQVDGAWKRFAKLFNVAALEEGPNGLVRLNARDLDRAAATTMGNWIDPKALKFSPAVSFRAEPDAYEIRFTQKVKAIFWLPFAGGSLALTLWVFDKTGAAGALACAVPALWCTLKTLARLLGTEVVRLCPSGIEHNLETPWGTKPLSQLPAELLTNCLIPSSKLPGSSPVALLAGSERLTFGEWLSPSDRHQARDLAILVLSHGPSRLALAV